MFYKKDAGFWNISAGRPRKTFFSRLVALRAFVKGKNNIVEIALSKNLWPNCRDAEKKVGINPVCPIIVLLFLGLGQIFCLVED